MVSSLVKTPIKRKRCIFKGNWKSLNTPSHVWKSPVRFFWYNQQDKLKNNEHMLTCALRYFVWPLTTKWVGYRNNFQQNSQSKFLCYNKKSNTMGCQATRSITHNTSKLKIWQLEVPLLQVDSMVKYRHCGFTASVMQQHSWKVLNPNHNTNFWPFCITVRGHQNFYNKFSEIWKTYINLNTWYEHMNK